MKLFTVVIRNVTDKTNKHKRKHCGSEEFRAGPLFLGLWWLSWCSGAGCTALGRFFRVGRSCSVLEYNGFPQVVQCPRQAFCVETFGFKKNGDFWFPFMFIQFISDVSNYNSKYFHTYITLASFIESLIQSTTRSR
jgi:hypothetical protein